jgi:hypothetical protein
MATSVCDLPHGLSRVRRDSFRGQCGTCLTASTTPLQIFFYSTHGRVPRTLTGIAFCRAEHSCAAGGGLCQFQTTARFSRARYLRAWLDGRWVLFDATRLTSTDRLVRVGWARREDVAAIFGGVQMVAQELRWRATNRTPRQCRQLPGLPGSSLIVTPMRLIKATKLKATYAHI